MNHSLNRSIENQNYYLENQKKINLENKLKYLEDKINKIENNNFESPNSSNVQIIIPKVFDKKKTIPTLKTYQNNLNNNVKFETSKDNTENELFYNNINLTDENIKLQNNLNRIQNKVNDIPDKINNLVTKTENNIYNIKLDCEQEFLKLKNELLNTTKESVDDININYINFLLDDLLKKQIINIIEFNNINNQLQTQKIDKQTIISYLENKKKLNKQLYISTPYDYMGFSYKKNNHNNDELYFADSWQNPIPRASQY